MKNVLLFFCAALLSMTLSQCKLIESIFGRKLDPDQTGDCRSGAGYYRALRIDPDFKRKVGIIESETKDFIKRRLNNRNNEDRTVPYVIPVVVHVVWTSEDENISDAQIRSAIDLLNRNYNAAHPSTSTTPAAFQPRIGNPRIRFQLAVRDPMCNRTNGIIRVWNAKGIDLNPIDDRLDPEGELLRNNPVKQLSPAWPMDKYLNIWVCRFTGGLNGYSSFPGMPANVDGIAVRHGVFGNIGTAAGSTPRDQTVPSHEIGHWLNLLHIWGDGPSCIGDDRVADTPLQGGPTAFDVCPSFPAISCFNGPNGNMYMNYMDYAGCRFMFSSGQVDRMHATLSGVRAPILASDALTPPTGIPGADLYIQDTREDVGNEPNNESSDFHLSEDIWIRQTNDGFRVPSYQDAIYKTRGYNYVYVRIRNRGCNAAPPAKVHLYWAHPSAGLSWPAPWDGSITTPVPGGGLIGTQTTASIPSGGAQVLEFAWRVPNPSNYCGLNNADPHLPYHFCLLARMEEPGVTLKETSLLISNVKNNNNIVSKNVTVGGGNRCLIIGDFAGSGHRANLRIFTQLNGRRAPEELKWPVAIDLGETLFNKWYADNKTFIDSGDFRSRVRIEGTRLIPLTGNAEIPGFNFGPGERHNIRVQLLQQKFGLNREQFVTADLQQVDAVTQGVIGGVNFRYTIFPVVNQDTKPIKRKGKDR